MVRSSSVPGKLWYTDDWSVWPRGDKTFFMLNLAEHEIFSANKYENANGIFIFIKILAEKFSCSAMLSKKEFVIVSNLRFISMKKFMLS